MVAHLDDLEGTFWRDLFHEIGFALIVAVVIWTIFEFFTRAEHEKRWAQHTQDIAKGVFFGVFRRNFPDEYIKEAHNLVLDHRFIRFGLNVTYTLVDDTFTNRAGNPQKFVRLHTPGRLIPIGSGRY